MVTRTGPWMGVSVAIIAAAIAAAAPMRAQQAAGTGAPPPRALTAADYARAEKFMTYNVTPLVLRARASGDLAAGRPVLVPRDDRDRQRGDPRGSGQGDEGGLRPAGLRRRRRQGAARRGQPAGGRRTRRGADGRAVARRQAHRFIRDWNLWVRDVATGKETQLTTDGVKDFGYATDNAGWTKSDRPILVWSPDSKQIATFQQDQREVGEMYLVSTKVGHPQLEAWKYPLPGDRRSSR